MIEIKLFGPYGAMARGIVVDYNSRRRGSPICDLARKLLQRGYSPKQIVFATRDDKLAIAPLELGKLSELAVRESDNSTRSAHFVKYRPFSKPEGNNS